MNVLPVGKLRAHALQALFDRHPTKDARVIVGPRVGEDAAVIDLGDRYLVATSDPITAIITGSIRLVRLLTAAETWSS